MKLSLHPDGKYIQIKISSSTHETLTSVSSNQSEIYLQLDQEAVGICHTQNLPKSAVTVSRQTLNPSQIISDPDQTLKFEGIAPIRVYGV